MSADFAVGHPVKNFRRRWFITSVRGRVHILLVSINMRSFANTAVGNIICTYIYFMHIFYARENYLSYDGYGV